MALQDDVMPIGRGGFNLVRMRYHIKSLPERPSTKPEAGGWNLEKPCGVHLEPPFPGARAMFVETVENGFVYVWWIDTLLTKSQLEGS